MTAGHQMTTETSSTADASAAKRTPDTYWLLEGATLLFLNAMGGLYVQGEENIPASGACTA